MEENTITTELLETIAKNQKKMLKLSRIRTALTGGILLLFIIVAVIEVPKVNETMENANKTLKTAQTAASDISRTVNELDDSIDGIDTLIKSANDLVDSNTQAVSDALEKINAIDFDTLNNAINDLSDVVQPLANFANAFR